MSHPSRRSSGRRSAFTLIEILLAVALLGAGPAMAEGPAFAEGPVAVAPEGTSTASASPWSRAG